MVYCVLKVAREPVVPVDHLGAPPVFIGRVIAAQEPVSLVCGPLDNGVEDLFESQSHGVIVMVSPPGSQPLAVYGAAVIWNGEQETLVIWPSACVYVQVTVCVPPTLGHVPVSDVRLMSCNCHT